MDSHTHKHTRTHAHTHTHTHTRTHAHTHMRTHAHARTHTHTHADRYTHRMKKKVAEGCLVDPILVLPAAHTSINMEDGEAVK